MSRATQALTSLKDTNIRWIAFDAVGTLIEPSPPVHVVYHQAAARHGSRLSLEDIQDRWPAAYRSHSHSETAGDTAPDHYEHTWATSEEGERMFWRKVVRTVIDDIDEIDRCFEELFVHFGRPKAWTCFADVGPTLERLRSAGYRLAVASNFDGRLHAICDGCPELRPLELRVISALVGHRKPSPQFYRTLVEATGARVDEILMVGNDQIHDVQAAREAGLPAVLIDRRRTSPAPHEIRSLSELVDPLSRRSGLF